MPANLPPQYMHAENEYRRAQNVEEQLRCLEVMLQLIPKHKGTDRLQADLKTRLKETRAEVLAEKSVPKKGPMTRIPRQGAGTVVILGAPNSGKSRIVAELTNAEPDVAPYPFTTREPLPAMMPWEDVFIQLVDTPPVNESCFEPYLVSYVRAADLVLLCFDGSSDDAPEETVALLEQFESRKTLLADATGFDEEDFTKLRVKTLLVVTRSDDSDADTRLGLLSEMAPGGLPILKAELDREESRERLRDAIFHSLGVIRLYTKAPNKPALYEDPFTIREGGTVEELARRVHHEIAAKLKHARIWGAGVHDGQSVGREYVLRDRDMVELHT